jgi:hypothetical protein
VGIVTEQQVSGVAPADVTDWLSAHGWSETGRLGDIASRWETDGHGVVVPLLDTSPDFGLRWDEMLTGLADALDTDPEGVVLAVTKAGSDIAEFRAAGEGRIDDSIPLGDAAVLIESVRRLLQASANSTLQPRSYYGHSLPDAAREHARSVRMGQTRRGSYIVPVISRVPILEAEDDDDALLFEDDVYQPFARSAMLRLAQGLTTLRDLTHSKAQPTRSQITESVGAGVSSELCEAVASTLETESIANLDVSFSWAERLPVSSAYDRVVLEGAAAPAVREVANILKGQAVVGRQTFVGYVKRLDRGEEDEIGRITLRALDNDKARNITMDLTDDDYHVAGEANTDRRMVSATGVLQREPGRALRFTEVTDFHLIQELLDLPEEPD